MNWQHRQLKRRRGLVNVETTDRVSVTANNNDVQITIIVEKIGVLARLAGLARVLRGK
jgi:glutamine synthetase type III